MSGDTERKSVQVRIEGRVQGVWYRGWALEQAKHLHLDGWVRNRADGSVEALFSGVPKAVDSMLSACWRGPPAAMVSDVTVHSAAHPEKRGFHPLATL